MMLKYNNCRQGSKAPTIAVTTFSKKKRKVETTQLSYPIDTAQGGKAPFVHAHDFRNACLDKNRPMDPYFIFSLYEDQDKPTALQSGIIQAWVNGKHKQYRDIIWQDTYILQHHLEAYQAYGCQVKQILETLTQPPPQPSDIPPLLIQCISEDTPLIKVRWEHTREKENSWKADFPQQAEGLLHEFELQQRTLEEENKPSFLVKKRNQQLSLPLQQGLSPQQRVDFPLASQVKDMVCIHTDPVNPDRDAQSTGDYEMYHDPDIPGAITLHDPQGLYLGSTWLASLKHIDWDMNSTGKKQLAILCQSLLNPPKSTKRNKRLGNTLQQVAHMPGWITGNLWRLHNSGWNDVMSTPLSVSPGCATFSAPNTEQAKLGANGTWFSQPWYGFHILHHVPKHLGAKAIRWAITSTLQEEHPTAIMALLASSENWSQNWLDHPSVTPLASIPPSLLQTKKGVFQGSLQEDSLHTPTQKHTLYLIANKGGREHLFPTWTDHKVKERLFPPSTLEEREDGLNLKEMVWLQQVHSQHKHKGEDPTLRPKALRSLMAQATWAPPTKPACKPLPSLNTLIPKWDSNIFSIYTDGSCLQTRHKNLCGAGIYIPAMKKGITIDPRGQGETNTINRAELMAIREATSPEVVPLEQDVYIFTDSMCSELQINKYLLQPEAFRFHTHKDLIRSISEQTRDRAQAGGRTHIYKVKGHSGVKGNEKADAVAGLARQLVTEGKETDRHGGMIEAEPRKHMYWPHHKGQSIPNLKQAARNLARLSRQDLTLCTGLYQRLHIQGNLIWGPGATRYIVSRGTDQRTRDHLCKFLSGSLCTGKIDARNAGIPNWAETICACCSRMDGLTHTMSGCKHPKMVGCYINRHNKAVRTAAKFIKESKHPYTGKATYIMDAGTPEEGEGFMGTRIPQWMHPTDNTQWTHRPDILLLIPEHEEPTPIVENPMGQEERTPGYLQQLREDYTLLIIEVGFTSDYRLAEKDTEKQKQHTDLAVKLKQQGWRSPSHQGPMEDRIDTVSIPIGVCGRYLEDTHQSIQRQLAIPYETTTRMLQKMGGVGIESFVSIYQCKRMLDREIKAQRAGSG